MAALHSIHFGVNRVDPSYYGTDAPLRGCENDARDMQKIASALGYQTELFLTRSATSDRYFTALSQLSKTLKRGDTLLVTLACDGSQVKDTAGDEEDGEDETSCFYDRMVLDDETRVAFARFAQGVRIFFVPDTCHSASATRAMLGPKGRSLVNSDRMANVTGFRCIDPFLGPDFFRQHRPEFARIKSSVSRAIGQPGGPDVISISGCKDDQTSADGVANGKFTENLKKVWANGAFAGSYEAFHTEIAASMGLPGIQDPVLEAYGPNVSAFRKERPFAPAAGAQKRQSAKKKPGSDNTQNGWGESDMLDSNLHPSVMNIVRSRGSRGINGGFGIFGDGFEGGCYIRVDRAVLDGKTDEEILGFFTEVVAPEVCSNYFVARDAFGGVAPPRGGSFSCTVGTRGASVSCTGTWTF